MFKTVLHSKGGQWLLSLLCGLILVLIFLLLLALCMSCFQIPVGRASLLSTLALCGGSFVAGWLIALLRRRSGLLCGCLAGFCLGSLLCVTGLLSNGFHLHLISLLHLTAASLSGGIGGILGVNRSLKKRLRLTK